MAAAMLANGGNPQQPSPKRPEQQQGAGGQKVAAGGPNAAPLLPNSAKDNKNNATLIKVYIHAYS
jgi:hypothetical protein